ncbi:2Fe-2S iron-sulfur cluster-binding protein [Paraburkholderia sp. CNPSo 3274]|uniref:2Fe-2S iron-sulfur cluster-binding protein n=1 Tax=Paraburkholderia sp. CNPSo 3274 TaxID=2940932 RepID=UPI0020B6D070|nr:2Fe-2S iron-sulfur cluster-binding protein [Paraburkholderia sp. CNPSo 3274]MCP3707035.1 2Fe-2S iron-sulfur cluster-binding protein [Paraburkholderia sp. CNPSo 3274]
MPKIAFIEHDNTEHTVNALAGQSLMQAAIDNSVPRILADCGGYCNCATCHCYVDDRWAASIPPAKHPELDMLSGAIDANGNSRLGCQILLTNELEGLVVRLPVSQI